MIPHAKLSTLQATEALAVIAVDLPEDGPVWEGGELYGPRCTTARTLAATYPARPTLPRTESPGRWEFAVPDPCYWTPDLPFLYDLNFSSSNAAPANCPLSGWLGLRGLHRHRLDLRLENRRHVLRGVVAPTVDESTRAAARSVDAVLWTCQLDADQLASAAQDGVWIVVDLRSPRKNFSTKSISTKNIPTENLNEVLHRLNWNPAVAMVVLSAEQLLQVPEYQRNRLAGPALPNRLLLAQAVTMTPNAKSLDAPPTLVAGADLVAWECWGNQQPPQWLVHATHPVIVRQRSVKYADLASARRGCDQLQANLASAGNLAGYFVELGP